MPCVYRITNVITNRVYIGQTTRMPTHRWAQHKYLLRNNKHNNGYLQNSWNKHGEQFFRFDVIYEPKDPTDQTMLDKAEEFYVDWCDSLVSRGGYNLRSGGQGAGKMHQETKNKIGDSNRGRSASKEVRDQISRNLMGAKNPNFGTHFSNDRKIKSRKSQPNRKPVFRVSNETYYPSAMNAMHITGVNQGTISIKCNNGGDTEWRFATQEEINKYD